MAVPKKDETLCPGCGRGFSEPEWAHDKPVAEWPVIDGKQFHGMGCVRKWQEEKVGK